MAFPPSPQSCNAQDVPETKTARGMSFQLQEADVMTTPLTILATPSSLASNQVRLKTAGYSIGKQAHNCEDAFFISERGFGVADGVSGWNDYGFSSHLFANQLMEFSRAELEKHDKMAQEMTESKQKLKKSKRSFVNFENLDDEAQS